MPVEAVGDHPRTARAADAEVIADPRAGRPIGGRTGLVHDEFDVELAPLRIETARGEVAHDRAHGVGREHQPVVAEHRHGRPVLARRGKEQLDVIVERGRYEIVQILAVQSDAQQMRAQRLHPRHPRQAQLERMADADDREIVGC